MGMVASNQYHPLCLLLYTSLFVVVGAALLSTYHPIFIPIGNKREDIPDDDICTRCDGPHSPSSCFQFQWLPLILPPPQVGIIHLLIKLEALNSVLEFGYASRYMGRAWPCARVATGAR